MAPPQRLRLQVNFGAKDEFLYPDVIQYFEGIEDGKRAAYAKEVLKTGLIAMGLIPGHIQFQGPATNAINNKNDVTQVEDKTAPINNKMLGLLDK